ncbi:hypothetical protein PPTG_05427 [Phytophthora nicotianae INRA-310]|uniref:Uncharacterized protein n=1 Tax=Phytophthora nicotianae (strain INRA-310) TaxID=761204 RepID=W2QWT5_PHYN3|nr:hypothetical protein PPTG_05427 [Phytophthora nicotianae INRA-310]ETN17682.1 hypothetical protein PPTG_05427 [Phytophthora nicotianae INRA-310]
MSGKLWRLCRTLIAISVNDYCRIGVGGRRFRGGSKGSDAPHYAQITLGIEKDHYRDEDFTPGNEGAVLDDHKALKTRKQSGKQYYICRVNKRKKCRLGKPDDLGELAKHRAATTTISDKGNNKRPRAPEDDKSLCNKPVKPTKKKESKRPDIENILKKVETGKKMENGEEVDSNKKVESAEGGEIVESVEAPKNMESGHSVEGSERERGENGESEAEKQASKRRVESVDSVKSAKNVENKDTVESVGSTEYLEGVDTMASSEGDFDGYKPRKRGSQHIAELDTMAVQQEQNVNIIASSPKVPTK